eukprot:TRINITY_DN11961_c0_g1_i3.p2 TRINITY_DN11961_c0_g1~~TRINITY_DN11961_c0_g1_i3.p2  ORF type:complete len:165 (+),score=26.93 TRINITY_DN11961_c0_g1_i3:198-692(+)
MREAHRKTAVELSGCCRQLAAGVEYLHEELVCHRDIQPCNVLLVDSDLDTVCVKLIEFSTAKDFEKGVASMRTKVCTPSYVAPEILSQDEVLRRSRCTSNWETYVSFGINRDDLRSSPKCGNNFAGMSDKRLIEEVTQRRRRCPRYQIRWQSRHGPWQTRLAET